MVRKTSSKFLISVCMSFRMKELGCDRTDVHRIDIWIFIENVLRKFKLHLYLTRLKNTVYEGLGTFVILRWGIVLRMEIIITKNYYTPNENILYILEKGIHFE